ncbi:L,D-transpeptidase [Nocardioides stalactiti]|uniref:L,D-transpeptidase n=1 Tax=Nocardioides stalactiti TaxID=2755356 RepID=UPI0015FED60F|nr:L,D-transpeptidase [Nocardioides stalactiti]
MRPRYGRIAIFTAAATVTGIAVLGGVGLLPNGPEGASAEAGLLPARAAAQDDGAQDRAAERQAASSDDRGPVAQLSPSAAVVKRTTTSLPADSGTGRRVVFSEGAQRVWLVDAAGVVTRTYLVSGSATDNLDPGTYEVYSRSRYAVGIDDSGTMQYFVRFTHGPTGAAIGFHTIPVDDGTPVQTTAQLGTPLSHGCIRQRTGDAIELWDFAPLGTTVVVTA